MHIRPEVELPVGAKILKVDIDPMGVPSIWYRFDQSVTKKQVHKFWCIATGAPMPDAVDLSTYRATLVEQDLVWHIFG